MKKQTIEIEVPEGKKAIFKNGQIKFVPEEPYWKNITTFEQAYRYVCYNLPECKDLITTYQFTLDNSFEHDIICYRIIVAALTNNEERHLTTGAKWLPLVQFCYPENQNNCWGNVLIGTIKSKGKEYSVMGGSVNSSADAGLGDFGSFGGMSRSYAAIGFRSVSSREIAQHISTYFGKLLFEIQYGGTNCDWKWV